VPTTFARQFAKEDVAERTGKNSYAFSGIRVSAIGMRDPSSSARDETIFARRVMESLDE
jgi:hypothetical protein